MLILRVLIKCMNCMTNCMHNSCLFHMIVVFMEFSRNRLAGDEPPPGDSSFYGHFGVPEMELPSGTSLPAKRRVTDQPSFWVLLELLSGDEHPPSDANQILVRFWYFKCFGMTLIGGKANFNG